MLIRLLAAVAPQSAESRPRAHAAVRSAETTAIPSVRPCPRRGWGAAPLLLLLALAFLASRLFRLTLLPVFFDEAIYLQWAARFRGSWHTTGPLEGGKLLHIVVTSWTAIGGADPLWQARATMACVSLATLWGTYRLGALLGGTATATLSAVLYTLSPFALFYDRMNLADGYLSAFFAWSLVATVELSRRPGPGKAVLLGACLAGSVLAKVTGGLTLLLPPAAFALVRSHSRQAGRWLLASCGLAAALVALPVAKFLTTRGEIQAKGYVGQRGWVDLAAGNLADMAGCLWLWWTPPVCLLLGVGAWSAMRREQDTARLALFAALLPIASFAALARVWYPRYLLFATVPALALAGRALVEVGLGPGRAKAPRGFLAIAMLAASVVASLQLDAQILADPSRADLPAMERFQYVEGWPSGYGWRESAAFLDAQQRRLGTRIAVVTDPDHPALAGLFLGDARVRVRGLPLDSPRTARRLCAWAGAQPTFIVTGQPMERGRLDGRLPVEHVAGFTKPGGRAFVNVYRVSPAHCPGAAL